MALVACVNAAFTLSAELPDSGLRTRGLHLLYDAGHVLALGVAASALVAGFARWGRALPPLLGPGLLALSALPVGLFSLRADLVGFVSKRVPLAVAAPLEITLVVAAAVGLGLAVVVVRRVPPRWRWLVVAAGVSGVVGHQLVLRDDYPGVHLFVALYSATTIAAAVSGLPLPRIVVACLPGAAWAVPVLLGVWSVSVWPSNAVMIELLRSEGSVVAQQLARARSAIAGSGASVPPEAAEWFASRKEARPVPATSPPLLGDPPVVLLFTIDSLPRSSLTPRALERTPTLARLMRESVVFDVARTPGSQTVVTLASLFAGTYFSQQLWRRHTDHPDLFPHEDPTPRFPQILTAAGVQTLNVSGSFWMVDGFGLVRGFAHEEKVKSSKKTRYATAEDLTPRFVELLGGLSRDRPIFGYLHFFDTHYMLSDKLEKGNKKERAAAGLRRIDEQLGVLLNALDRLGLADRAALVVTSDHGEAFGEHGTNGHGTTLYEELLRVPLFFRVPGVEPRKVSVPVSVIDVGPTILDLFGHATPPHFMGQSLVGFLRGRTPKLTRPIVAEGRLKKAMLFADGKKVILDDRVNTVELFDLTADAAEKNNLVDALPDGGAARIDVLRSFFSVHRVRERGYEPPYRK